MSSSEKDLRHVRKKFEDKGEKIPDKLRLGNHFVDDFIFDDQQAADIPINALRVIFNIVAIIGNEQFRPEDRPKQLSLFDEEFESGEKNMNEYTEELLKEEINNTRKNSNTIKEYKKWKQENKK